MKNKEKSRKTKKKTGGRKNNFFSDAPTYIYDFFEEAKEM